MLSLYIDMLLARVFNEQQKVRADSIQGAFKDRGGDLLSDPFVILGFLSVALGLLALLFLMRKKSRKKGSSAKVYKFQWKKEWD